MAWRFPPANSASLLVLALAEARGHPGASRGEGFRPVGASPGRFGEGGEAEVGKISGLLGWEVWSADPLVSAPTLRPPFIYVAEYRGFGAGFPLFGASLGRLAGGFVAQETGHRREILKSWPVACVFS